MLKLRSFFSPFTTASIVVVPANQPEPPREAKTTQSYRKFKALASNRLKNWLKAPLTASSPTYTSPGPVPMRTICGSDEKAIITPLRSWALNDL